MRRINLYSTLRREPAHVAPDGYSMHAFYTLGTKPASIVILIFAVSALLYRNDIGKEIESALEGNLDSISEIVQLVISFTIGLRLVQSLFLAKRDYGHLSIGLLDIIAFLPMLAFTTGTIVYLIDSPRAVFVFFAAASVIGVLNFGHIWLHRLDPYDDSIDYIFERRIQLVNTATCLIIAVIFIVSAVIYGDTTTKSGWALAISLGTIPVVAFNIGHSHSLSMADKFHIDNTTDSPESIANTFNQDFGHIGPNRSDAEIKQFVFGKAIREFQPVRFDRAAIADVDVIATSIISEFGYVYRWIFEPTSEERLHKLVRRMLLSARGFGSHGILNYYNIVDPKSSKNVGWVKFHSRRNQRFYQWWDFSAGLLIACVTLGTVNVPRILHRLKMIDSQQRGLLSSEIRIDQIVIFEESRCNGYCFHAIAAARNAFAVGVNNDIVCDRVSMFVRQDNANMLRIAKQLGFELGQDSEVSRIDKEMGVSGLGYHVYVDS